MTDRTVEQNQASDTRPIEIAALQPAAPQAQTQPLVEIGVLTIGKPTFTMAVSSLLLQDEQQIRIHIVDTAATPIINRQEVQWVLRLAADRGVTCTYEHLHDEDRAFSVGRLALLETLRGSNLCFMDDDIVMPAGALRAMLDYTGRHPSFGWLAPTCKNIVTIRTALGDAPRFSPGGILRQDRLIRNILLEYYETTVDVLDKRPASKVWEIAFLTELFPMLGRSTHVQSGNVIYHLDYNERPNWNLLREDLVRATRRKAEELVAKYSKAMEA